MWSMRARYFGLGLVVGTSGAAIYIQSRKQGLDFGGESVRHRALKYGAPAVDRLRFFGDFVISYDTRTKCPEWALERISRTDQLRTGDRTNVEFKEDESFEERFRSHLAQYRGSGYDRGHMAPAANHKADQAAMDSTFFLTNVCPQVGIGFNRDYWARFERFVNLLTKTSKDVFIITGPLYLPHKTSTGYEMRHSFIGEPPNLVSVPTHFFKVILADTEDREPGEAGMKTAVGAFVMPNAPIDPEVPLTAFTVPLQHLEAVSGLQFFPGFMTRSRQAFHDHKAFSWQRKGHQQLLEQQTLRLHDLLNPVKALERSPDPFAGLSVFSSSLEAAEEELHTTPSQLLGTQVGKADGAEGGLDDATPQRSLLHNDVSTADPLRRPGVKSDNSRRTTAAEPKPSSGSETDRTGLYELRGQKEGSSKSLRVDKKHPMGAIQRRKSFASEEIALDGVVHLCDHSKCVLPPPDWYLKRRQAALEAAAVSEAETNPAA